MSVARLLQAVNPPDTIGETALQTEHGVVSELHQQPPVAGCAGLATADYGIVEELRDGETPATDSHCYRTLFTARAAPALHPGNKINRHRFKIARHTSNHQGLSAALVAES